MSKFWNETVNKIEPYVPATPPINAARAPTMAASAPCARREPNSNTVRPRAARLMRQDEARHCRQVFHRKGSLRIYLRQEENQRQFLTSVDIKNVNLLGLCPTEANGDWTTLGDCKSFFH